MNRSRARFSRKERLTLAILGALPLPFFLALFGPLDAFASNRGELGFSAGAFLPLCLLVAGVSAALLFLLLFFLPDGGFRIVFPVILALSVSAAVLPPSMRLSRILPRPSQAACAARKASSISAFWLSDLSGPWPP